MLPDSVKGTGASKMCSAGVERTGAPEASIVAVLLSRGLTKVFVFVFLVSRSFGHLFYRPQLPSAKRGVWDYQMEPFETLILSINSKM